MVPRKSEIAPSIDISYIVSAYDRPLALPVILWAIANQTHQNFEVIVTDNAVDDRIAARQQQMVKDMKDARFRYVRTAGKIKVSDCYWSAEWAIDHMARGTWLSFPCDDTYIVPDFGAMMLEQAIRENADFIYCQKILVGTIPGGGWNAGYHVWEMQLHRTTKTTFMVRRAIFPGFHGKLSRGGASLADYVFSSQMSEQGRRISVLKDKILVAHN